MPIKFGPSGNGTLFYNLGFKHSYQAPKWLSELSLNAYEYSCSKGCNIGEKSALMLGLEAKEHGISLSIHAPYYINLTSEAEKKEKSIDYILQTLRVADIMNATRIVVHSGGCAKLTRIEAMRRASETLVEALEKADEHGLGHIHICPETMGKINQLGTLEEVIELCLLDDRLIPTIDFGHLNCRIGGGIEKEYENILDSLENKLGRDRAKVFHAHFSKIEYSEKGGEKKHLTFEDEIFGPEFEPLAELIYKKGLEPTIICESDGVMVEDALSMKKIYEEL